MKRSILTLIAATTLCACSSETDARTAPQTPASSGANETKSSSPKAGLFGINKEARFIQVMEDGFETQMLLYTRADPRIAEMMNSVNLDAGDKDKLRCAYREMKKAGMEKQIDMSIEANVKLRDVILANPDVSFKNIEDFTDIVELMDDQGQLGTEADRKAINAINSECGVMTMLMAKMEESGVMQAMMQLNVDD
ncbi:MAG: hypothetical protein AAFQ15_11535 [Pseudomonadota bacterium]